MLEITGYFLKIKNVYVLVTMEDMDAFLSS